MPAATEGPTVALSYDAGVGPLLDRMLAAKQTNDELRSFYNARASIEDDYARKLLSLSRKSLGSQELGSLKMSLDTVRGEVESMAKQHASIAAQMKTELEEPLAAFAGGMKERRKIIQYTVEKLLKIKVQQTQQVNKTRDRYEQECLKIKGYLAQGHMVMGQEERKNKAKLEKTQISLATSNTEYEAAVKTLEETTTRWNREWKAAADKFQDLEEERLDFTKSSLWTFANLASTVCVSDDASCEKIRLSLEKMEVEKDIVHFIKERGTGQEIPDAPKYINFCRGDVEDHESIASVEDESYSVAQFPRSINPAFRSSSPQPSTYESHHDPNNGLARDLGHHDVAPPISKEPVAAPVTAPVSAPVPAPAPVPVPAPAPIPALAPQKGPGSVIPPRSSRQGHYSQQQPQQQQQQYHHQLQQQPPPPQQQPLQQSPPLQQYHQQQHHQLQQQPPPPQQQSYDASQFAAVPHDPYPLDGMTMLCRTDGMNSGMNSATSSNLSGRPSSRDDNSIYSNPTSLSSQEPPSGLTSPAKQPQQQPPPPQPEPEPELEPEPQPVVEAQSDRRVLKKKSGFFQNHSPFRRKSTKEVQRQNRNTWGPVSTQSTAASSSRRPQVYQPDQSLLTDRSTITPEPIDANASLALNIGQNVFPVSTPDKRKKSVDQGEPPEDLDPIALALAELKGVQANKQSAVRVSADHYHGISTPAPGQDRERPNPFSRSAPAPRKNSDVAAGMRGTPPPSYDQQVQRLGVPAAAVTSKAMQETSRKYVEQTRDIFNNAAAARPGSRATGYATTTPSRPPTRGNDMPRAASPAAPRNASPRVDARQIRAASPAPPRNESPRVDARQMRAPSPAAPRNSSPRVDARQNQAPASPRVDARQIRPSASPQIDPRQTHAPASPRIDPRQTHASASPRIDPRQSHHSASPNPYSGSRPRSDSQMGTTPQRGSDTAYYRQNSPNDMARTASPASFRNVERPSSSHMGSDMAVQLASVPDQGGYGSQQGRNSRPGTSYGSGSGALAFYDGRQLSVSSRQRSRSVADPSRQYTPDGRAILHFARALYMYQAAIPEELGFSKGDVLAVLRHQDDGWWEAEIHAGSGQGQQGLVPSNYLQPC